MKTIAILGASYLQLPLILEAKKIGLRVIGFAWEEGAVAKPYFDKFYPYSVLDKERILEVCRLERINGITSIASDIVVPTISYVATRLGLISNSEQSALFSTNKFLMREVLYKNGVNCPVYMKFDNSDELNAACEFEYPMIVKPTDRSGSLGVTKVNNKKELVAASDKAFNYSFNGKIIVEKFVDGREVSVEAISMDGKHEILAITDKIVSGPPHFVELEHHQPTTLGNSLSLDVKKCVINSLNALDIKYGASHSELIITEDGEIFVTEIGARMGGDFIGSHLVKLSTGYNFLKGVIEVALGYFTEADIKFNKNSGVYFYHGANENIKKYIVSQNRHSEIVESSLFETGPNLKFESSSDRLGYFIYQAEGEKFIVE